MAHSSSNNQLLAFDSHVHLHDPSHLMPMLNAARTAFARAVGAHMQGAAYYGMLALTEPATRNTFDQLRQQLSRQDPCPIGTHWHLARTSEPCTLAATHTDGDTIFLLSGQQIVTREKLEVLSLATEPTIDDGQSLAATIAQIQQRAGFPIIPWGAGKWLGARGAAVSAYLQQHHGQPFALGDNGGRPSFWRRISQFTLAQHQDLLVLRGSDPLPLRGSYKKTGRFGTLLHCPFDPSRPAGSLVEALSANRCTCVDFGHLTCPLVFLHNQLSLRLRKS